METAELFRVMEGNGLTKEQHQVLRELGEVKEQLDQIRDGVVRASAMRAQSRPEKQYRKQAHRKRRMIFSRMADNVAQADKHMQELAVQCL